MAYTTEQLAAIEAALASGQRVVQYNNRRIEYHSLTELSALRDRIAASLASGPAARPRRILLRHGGKGIT
jgi:hypothetical protein